MADTNDLKKIIGNLEQSRIFASAVAESVRRRHGSENARRVVECVATLDELIRTARETDLVNEVVPHVLSPSLDLTGISTTSVSVY